VIRSRHQDLVLALSGALAAYVAFCVLVWLHGEAPRAMLALLFRGTWGTAYGAGQVLFKATPLLITGLAVHVALRAGLFNIGAEGQLAIASLAVGAVGARLGGTPAIVAVPLLLCVSMIAGALWAAPPAILRSHFSAHEVIGAIMMNRIADAAVGLGLSLGLADPGSVHTRALAAGAHLPRLSRFFPAFEGSAVSVALFIALALSVAVMILLPKTRAGKEQELVGLHVEACRAERIPVRRRLFEALVFSGAITGLASAGTVLGYKGYFELGLGSGAGFTGLAVALLGRGRLAGLLFAALLFATLQQGGLAVNAHVPMDVMTVIQGVVIVALALADARVRALVRRKT
jgi:simple sugar transport system permease protein